MNIQVLKGLLVILGAILLMPNHSLADGVSIKSDTLVQKNESNTSSGYQPDNEGTQPRFYAPSLGIMPNSTTYRGSKYSPYNYHRMGSNSYTDPKNARSSTSYGNETYRSNYPSNKSRITPYQNPSSAHTGQIQLQKVKPMHYRHRHQRVHKKLLIPRHRRPHTNPNPNPNPGPTAVPELDPASAQSALCLLIGAILVLNGRSRRRKSVSI